MMPRSLQALKHCKLRVGHWKWKSSRHMYDLQGPVVSKPTLPWGEAGRGSEISSGPTLPCATREHAATQAQLAITLFTYSTNITERLYRRRLSQYPLASSVETSSLCRGVVIAVIVVIVVELLKVSYFALLRHSCELQSCSGVQI